MQTSVDESAKKLNAQSVSFQSQLAAALSDRDAAHAASVESMQTRIKELLGKKEAVIEALKKKVQELESELQQLHQEMEQINS
jgi:chromosome segregation ATPase